ncbi:MAG: T9SS type A sorting domain-containing protein [Bacteroidota bacterium]
MRLTRLLPFVIVLGLLSVWVLSDLPEEAISEAEAPTVPEADLRPFSERAEKQAPGPDQRPATWLAEQRLFPHFQHDAEAFRAAHAQALQMREATRMGADFGAWEQAGPTNVGGRITSIAFAESAPDVVYAGAATGGAFKSLDAGRTWTPIFDDQAVLPVGAVAVDPTDPDRAFVGTGESNGGSYNLSGGGVFRTEDGGTTWTSLGLEETITVGRIRIDPRDPDRVFVAGTGSYFGTSPARGVYRSTDGGDSWAQVLFVSDRTAAIDLVMHPTSPDTLYAAMWERERTPIGAVLSGPTSGVYRSADGGDTWALLGEPDGLPGSGDDIGRIGLTTCDGDPDRMYALYNDGRLVTDLYRSEDGGVSWARDRRSDGLTGFGGGFAWYFGNVRCDPLDAERVFVLDVPLVVWEGNGWFDQYGYDVLHVDHHALAFKPDDPTYLLSGNDGGFDISTDRGINWEPVNGLAITQFYEIGLDATNPERLYGGTQDNGTVRTRTGALDDYELIYGGDGFYVIIDPTNPDVIYAESQFGFLGKSIDGGITFEFARNGIDESEPTNWSTPVVMDPSDPETLYYGTNRVYRTTDGAAFWEPISPDLTTSAAGRLSVVTAISVSPLDPDVLWVGTGDGQVWTTDDGGATWTDRTGPLPFRYVTRVLAHPTDVASAYVTQSGLRWRDPEPRVFRTADSGLTWTSISDGLPDAPVNAIAVDPLAPDTVFVGTDVGPFVSPDAGFTWEALGTGIPAVAVFDLQVHPTARYLAAGTHARSLWTLPLPTNPVANEPTAGLSGFALASPWPNPVTASATVQYVLADTGPVRVEVFDVAGRRVAVLAEAVQASGTHTLTWAPETRLANGAYVVRLTAGDASLTTRMTLAR